MSLGYFSTTSNFGLYLLSVPSFHSRSIFIYRIVLSLGTDRKEKSFLIICSFGTIYSSASWICSSRSYFSDFLAYSMFFLFSCNVFIREQVSWEFWEFLLLSGYLKNSASNNLAFWRSLMSFSVTLLIFENYLIPIYCTLRISLPMLSSEPLLSSLPSRLLPFFFSACSFLAMNSGWR